MYFQALSSVQTGTYQPYSAGMQDFLSNQMLDNESNTDFNDEMQDIKISSNNSFQPVVLLLFIKLVL